MNYDNIDTFVLNLTDFLNTMVSDELDVRDFFDTDDKYLPLLDFVRNNLDKFVTKEINYN